MKATVVLFPGSNRDRDMIAALTRIGGTAPQTAWYADSDLPHSDLLVVPGGFSHGDYLRAGAIAARAPIMRSVVEQAGRGVPVLGICNGFQILTEVGLLPGVLMRNAGLNFVCREVKLEITSADNAFLSRYGDGEIIRCPVAHHDGNYFTDDDTLARLEGTGRVALRYADGTNPNGSRNDIAGVLNDSGTILGMMPHPENFIEPAHGGMDGRRLFEGALGLLEAAAA